MSSISQILRQTREAKGVSLDEVAQRTYIKLPYLVALEEGDIDKLPAPVYIHGYIRQYAKLLGLNGSDLVLKYQQDASRQNAGVSKLVLSSSRSQEATVGRLEDDRTSQRNFMPPDLRETSLTHSLDSRDIPLGREPQFLLSKPMLDTASFEQLLEPELEIDVEKASESLSPPPELSSQEIQQAKQYAHQIVNSAQREAHELRIAAERYADQVLAQLESEINRSLQTVRNGRAYLQSRRRKLHEG